MTASASLAPALRAAPSSVERRALLRARAGPEAVADLLRESVAARRSDPSDAERLARCALIVARGGRDPRAATLACVSLARAQLALGRPRHALRRLDAAAALDPAADLARDRAEALAQVGRWDDALAELRSARARLGPSQSLQRSLLTFTEATLCWRVDRNQEALALWDACRRRLLREKNPLLEASLEGNRANALSNLQRYEHADRLYRRAARVARAAGHETIALQSDYNRAYLDALRGRFHESLRALHALRPRFVAAGDERHAALCDVDEAETLLRLNLHAQARLHAERAVQALERLGLRVETARALFFSAVAARELGRRPEAETALHEAYDLFRREGCEGWEAICLRHLAEHDRARGEAGRAAVRAQRAARVLDRLGFADQAARAEMLLARLELEGGEAAAALDRLVALERASRDVHCPGVACDLHQALGRAHAALGHDRAAARHALRAVRLLERVRLGVPPDEYMAGFLRDKTDLYAEAVGAVLRLGGRRSRGLALELAEGARSRALLDLVRASAPAERPRDPLERERLALERRIDGHLSRLPRDGEGRRAAEGARSRAQAALLQRRRDLCLRRLAAEDPSAARRRVAGPPSAREIQARLPEGETLVEYFLRKDELCAFVVTRRDLALVRRPLRAEALGGLLARMRFQLDRPLLARPTEPEVDRALERSAHAVLEELHAALIAPILDLLPPGRLVIVPHGPLHDVPFPALERDGRPLVEDRSVSVAPSAAVYLRCLEAPAPNDGPAVVVGYADDETPGIERETREVARRLPGARVLLGRRATREALRRRVRDASVVHVATHAEQRDGEPHVAALRLADGWLTDAAVRDCRTNPRVLVLSGCSTGRSAVTAGDELFGLPRAFLLAGASSLVTSLWRVADESALRFMTAFHEALRAEGCAAEAVRRAALAVRREHPHPYHWAPFVHVGRASATPPRPRREPSCFVALSGEVPS